MSSLRAHDFDFALPPELIAQRPAPRRDHSRLMVVTRDAVRHHAFYEIGDLIDAYVQGPDRGPPPLLVLNDTRVIPARLYAHKLGPGDVAGGRVELLLCEPAAGPDPGAPPTSASAPGGWTERWCCLYRASKPLRPGAALRLVGDRPPRALVEKNLGGGRALLSFHGEDDDGLLGALARVGQIPLPPYIVNARRQAADPVDPEDDRQRYQTVYAQAAGSVAAPTAGLHFTTALLASLAARGIEQAAVTLHVGPGTFAPLTSEDPARHVMHAERYHISEQAAAQIRAAKRAGRKIIAVGTTAVRTLETATPPGEDAPRPGSGESALFIYPPYRFKVVDALITNFHLPRSTLLMLVAALAGRRRVLAAYAEAVAAGYRFYSYGDAMLIPAAMEDLA